MNKPNFFDTFFEENQKNMKKHEKSVEIVPFFVLSIVLMGFSNEISMFDDVV